MFLIKKWASFENLTCPFSIEILKCIILSFFNVFFLIFEWFVIYFKKVNDYPNINQKKMKKSDKDLNNNNNINLIK